MHRSPDPLADEVGGAGLSQDGLPLCGGVV